MLKGTRDGILKRTSAGEHPRPDVVGRLLHHVEDPDGQTTSRASAPRRSPANLEPGDRIQVEYLVGVVVKVTRRRS